MAFEKTQFSGTPDARKAAGKRTGGEDWKKGRVMMSVEEGMAYMTPQEQAILRAAMEDQKTRHVERQAAGARIMAQDEGRVAEEKRKISELDMPAASMSKSPHQKQIRRQMTPEEMAQLQEMYRAGAAKPTPKEEPPAGLGMRMKNWVKGLFG